MTLSPSATEAIARLPVSRSTVAATSPLMPWLPPLAEDSCGPLERLRVAGEVAKQLRSRTYEPAETLQVLIAKRTGGTRNVTLLTLTDRVVYEALVDSVSPLLERALCGRDVVFSPRARSRAQRWLSFERAPLRVEPTWIVMADVADCYANLSHKLVTEGLRRAGARSPADALEELLGRLMKRDTGVPQNLGASGALASVGLSRVDEGMLRRGWPYVRCSDDLRIGATTRDAADRAIAELGEELLAVGLRLRPEKTRILRLEDYKRRLNIGAPWENWMWSHVAPLVEGSLAYRRTVTIGEAARRRMLATNRGLKRATHELGEILDRHDRHDSDAERIRRVLDVIAAAHSPEVLDSAIEILGRHPAATDMVAKCLRALTRTDRWRNVVELVETALATDRITLASQRAWLFWVLQPVAERLPCEVVALVREAVGSEDWICRVQAAQLLAVRRELGAELRVHLQSTAPPPLRASFSA